MNIGYLIYQAERQPSAAERRAADIQRGEMALALVQLVRRPSNGDARGGSGGSRRRQSAPAKTASRREAKRELVGC